MDFLDEFNSTNQVTETSDEQSTNNQEEDLFGSELTDNTTAAASTNPFGNVQQQQQQQPDLSWAIDDDLTDTTTSQTNIFDGDNLENISSAPQTTVFDDDIFTTQSNTNEFESYPITNPPPTADEILYNDSSRRASEDALSFDNFTTLPSSSSPNPYSSYSVEDSSPLQAFNTRRQKEIAEMEVIEKQKIEELRQQGKKDLERWYEDQRTRMEQKRQAVRKDENNTVTQALEKSDKKSCDWAKVIRFLDFSQGTQLTKSKRDLNRMRTVIIQAKRDKDNRVSTNGV